MRPNSQRLVAFTQGALCIPGGGPSSFQVRKLDTVRLLLPQGHTASRIAAIDIGLDLTLLARYCDLEVRGLAPDPSKGWGSIPQT